MIFESKMRVLKDRLIEIRFFQDKIIKSNLSYSIQKIYASRLSYEKNTSRNCLSILIVILGSDDWQIKSVKINEWFSQHAYSDKIELMVVSERNIEDLDIFN